MSDETLSERPVKPRDFADLIVWQKGMLLAKKIYKLTSGFPTEEKYGLVSQLQRAAVSIPSNIAEGQGRNSGAEFVHFISIAEGSACEVHTQLLLSVQLGFCTDQQIQECLGLTRELRKMLNALRRTLITRHSLPVTPKKR